MPEPRPLGRVKARVERYRVAEELLEFRRSELYAAIREAVESGESLRTLAKVTGLSHSRIQQIADE